MSSELEMTGARTLGSGNLEEAREELKPGVTDGVEVLERGSQEDQDFEEDYPGAYAEGIIGEVSYKLEEVGSLVEEKDSPDNYW